MGNAGTKIAFASLISVSLLVVGNLIGAGILALPVNTGLAGFMPSLINMFVFGAAMFYSAVVLAKEANEAKEEHLIIQACMKNTSVLSENGLL
ncbi:MAG: hypothetical protein FJZ15_02285 [Candidatus Omnitrophica bacterium]|nr:hypothetical protein [Candidatus Omnitrophota bacterium]